MLKRFFGLLLLTLLLGSCTLRIGGPNVLEDAPAPTTVPLVRTAEPVSLPGMVAPQEPIALPPGFAITLYADGLRNPRMLAVGPDGELYVAERGADRVVRLPDRDKDGQLDELEVVAEGLSAPSSLAFYEDGSLYAAETTRVLRFTDRDADGVYTDPQVVIADLPRSGHNTRTLLFSPDWEHLYVSVGSSCNVCEEDDPRRAAIVRYNPDGSGMELFAVGLRNAVGITTRPGTEELWATNNGRDMLGDDLPPETVYLVEGGRDYGWPRCHSGRISDPDFGSTDACADVVAPQVEMQAHSAPLGLTFYTGTQFPPEYQGDLFVAFHGSWNRSVPTGYKVVRIPMQDGRPGPVQDFASGWLRAGGNAWGRPVDVITGTDGSLFISDDSGGRVWRVFYAGE